MGQDTLIVISISQLKVCNSLLLDRLCVKELNDSLTCKVALQNKVIKAQDTIIKEFQVRNVLRNQIDSINNEIITNYKLDINVYKKDIKRQKLYKFISYGLNAVLVSLLILK